MGYKTLEVKKYKPKNGENYQKPILSKKEAKELLSDLEFRATFQDFSNEFRNSATSNDFT